MYGPEYEDLEYEFNARYDYLREAFGPTADDARRAAADDAAAEEEALCLALAAGEVTGWASPWPREAAADTGDEDLPF